MCLGISVNKNKIGNLMVFLADKLKPLYHTKLIKLLYLIDEAAVKDRGIPITWMDYKVWQYGPVAPETYYIKDGNSVFSEFISIKKTDKGTVIVPKKDFDDSEFSEYNFVIINQVLEEYGNRTVDELVQVTHEPGSLWSKTKEENNIDFSSPIANISNYSIDLSRLVEDDKDKLINYQEAQDMMYFRMAVEQH